MTLGEKEQQFLEALSAFYYDGTASISDAEFDLLKDELVWSGSKVAVLRCGHRGWHAQMEVWLAKQKKIGPVVRTSPL